MRAQIPLMVGALVLLVWSAAFEQTGTAAAYRAARQSVDAPARRAWARSLRRGVMVPPIKAEDAGRLLMAYDRVLAHPARPGSTAWALVPAAQLGTSAGLLPGTLHAGLGVGAVVAVATLVIHRAAERGRARKVDALRRAIAPVTVG